MSTSVMAYQTADGRLFKTQQEADKYETQLGKKPKIMDFLRSPDNTLQKIVKDEEILLDFIGYWEQWQKTH